MQCLLSHGDGEAAVKITVQNERILLLLANKKAKGTKSEENLIQELAASCLSLQDFCDKELKSITHEYKKELNTHLIRRQINEHLKNT